MRAGDILRVKPDIRLVGKLCGELVVLNVVPSYQYSIAVGRGEFYRRFCLGRLAFEFVRAEITLLRKLHSQLVYLVLAPGSC